MKSIFSTIMNNSLFNFAKRLAIVCVFLFLSISAAAGGTDYYARCSVAVATGSGSVYVSNKTTNILKTRAK